MGGGSRADWQKRRRDRRACSQQRGDAAGANLVPVLSPQVLRATRRELGVSHGRLDAAVPEVGLQGADAS